MRPPTQNTGNEIRETKIRDSYIAALNEAMIYSVQKHSTWLLFQVFHVARSTCCCEQWRAGLLWQQILAFLFVHQTHNLREM